MQAVLATGVGAAFLVLSATTRAAPATVVNLTQTACQFIESENGVDHRYRSGAKADCEAINAKSGEQRLDAAKALELKPGRYIFRVTNQDVPYDLGFWLRGEGLIGRASLPSVSGGGLHEGATLDYEIELWDPEDNRRSIAEAVPA